MKVTCFVPRLVAGLPRIASALTRVSNRSVGISNTGVNRKWLLKQELGNYCGMLDVSPRGSFKRCSLFVFSEHHIPHRQMSICIVLGLIASGKWAHL
jgi:hypothetical protein